MMLTGFYLKNQMVNKKINFFTCDYCNNALKNYYKPEWDLKKGGEELIAFCKKNNFDEKLFRGEVTNRLPLLKNILHKK